MRLARTPAEHGHRPALDPALRAAARAYGPRAVGVVLSGTRDDGTAGLASVKRAGGTALAQDPEEALHDGMPRSAVRHVDLDAVLPVAELGPWIAAHRLAEPGPAAVPAAATGPCGHPPRERGGRPGARRGAVSGDAPLDALLDHLKQARGFDFTGYKRATLERRVQKRMDAVGAPSYEAYLDHLELHPDEFALLFNTILINVTGVLPRPAGLGVRGPGRRARGSWRRSPTRRRCASGAPAAPPGRRRTRPAMLLAEALGERAFTDRVKIYATDVDEEALGAARQATYAAKAVEGVPPALLERYFDRVDQRWAFRKELRRSVIFGRNDLVQDAPISRIDLLTCRNTLMYFNAETQAQILRRLNFALNDRGFLFLGKSEMLITHNELFRPVDLKRRVFQKVVRPTTLRERLLQAAHGDGAEAAADAGDALRDGSSTPPRWRRWRSTPTAWSSWPTSRPATLFHLSAGRPRAAAARTWSCPTARSTCGRASTWPSRERRAVVMPARRPRWPAATSASSRST